MELVLKKEKAATRTRAAAKKGINDISGLQLRVGSGLEYNLAELLREKEPRAFLTLSTGNTVVRLLRGDIVGDWALWVHRGTFLNLF